MNLFRKRIVASLLAVTMIVSSLQFSAYDVYAKEAVEEISAAEEVMTEGELFESTNETSTVEEDIEDIEKAPATEEDIENTEKSSVAEEEPQDVEETLGETVAASENADKQDSEIITVEADFEGVYQFGGAPSGEALGSVDPYFSIKAYGLDKEVNGLTIEEYIYQEALGRNPAIDISAYGIVLEMKDGKANLENLSNILSGVINDHPDLYFVKKKWSASYALNSMMATSVSLYYSEYGDIDDPAFKMAAYRAVSLIDANMSDLQKAIILHDYIVVNCEYDYENYLNDTIPFESYTAYGVLVNRIAVCNGYALAYKYLLEQVGIECHMVSSSAMNHAWNLIVIDGECYQVDTTWDDPVYDRLGRVCHTYMFLSDEAFTDYDDGHHDWVVTDGFYAMDYEAKSIKYDNAFWADVYTPLVLTGDDWDDCYFSYYYGGDEEAGGDKEVDGDTTYAAAGQKINKTKLSYISDVGATICDIGGWSDTGLFQYNNRLYFNDARAIYSIDFEGNDKRTELEVDAYGDIYVRGISLYQGKVLYTIYKDGKYIVLETDIEIQYEESEMPEEIPVERIVLSHDTLTLMMDERAELKATATPSYATESTTITWESSNSSVAMIEKDWLGYAVIMPVSPGTCTITAKAGDKIATCNVTVVESGKNPPITTDAYIIATKVKTTYVCGDTLNTDDLTVTYYDNLGTASTVTDYTTNIEDIDMSTVGTKELIITYYDLIASVNIRVTSGNKEGIKIELKDPDKTHIYTGSAINPAIVVTNNGEPLAEGIDYTVKYSNNIKPSASARITVTGKGNLTQNYTKLFTIEKKQLDNKDISNEDVVSSNGTVHRVQGDIVTVVEGSKISPILLYNGIKLTSKDFKIPDEYKTFNWKLENNNKKITVTALENGNFKGTKDITVKVISKAEQKNYKLTVKLSNSAKKFDYNGQPRVLKIGEEVTVSTNNMPTGLIEGEDFIISYPNDITSAGTKKFTVTGISERCIGTVTKSYAIKPKKTEFVVEYDKDNKGYDFVSTGTTIPDDELIVRDPQFIDGAPLIMGKDYKVSYSGNKKVGTAKFTITGLGSYKGSKCTKTFTINNAVLNNNSNSKTGKTSNLEIVVADKVFKKAGVYKSSPCVSINGVLLKASDYTVTYYLDNPVTNPNPRVMDNKNKLADGDVTVWVKIVGKGNYAVNDDTCFATAYYRVRSLGLSDSYDLSKAKVTFQDKSGNAIKKIEYTGEPITGDDIKVVVTYKTGSGTVTLNDGEHYTVKYVNNVNKGKATVVITGMSNQNSYVGSKTATFSIVASNLKNLTQ